MGGKKGETEPSIIIPASCLQMGHYQRAILPLLWPLSACGGSRQTLPYFASAGHLSKQQ